MKEGFNLVLTEDGYTTVDGPMSREQALAEFDWWAPGTFPHSGSRLRVLSEESTGGVCPVHHVQLRFGVCAECGE